MADDSLYSLARTALLEITPADTIGEPLDVVVEDAATSTVHFANTLPGYPGWIWTVSVATLDGQEPSVLETELVPGDAALLAPEWVPWVERLAEYEASQESAGPAASDGSDEGDESEGDFDESDEDDDGDDDFDDDGDDGDDEFDGVDVEEAAEAAGLDGDDAGSVARADDDARA